MSDRQSFPTHLLHSLPARRVWVGLALVGLALGLLLIAWSASTFTAHAAPVLAVTDTPTVTVTLSLTITPTGPTPTLTITPTPTPTAPGHIVISEFRFEGPNGAKDEFVELFNPSSAPVDITGWKLWGSNSSGITSVRTTFPATVLQPGRHFLIAYTGAGGYSGTVTPDDTYGVTIAADGGIAISKPDDTIVDQVGLNAGSAYSEGTLPVSSPGQVEHSYERNPGGSFGSCYDTDNNFNDFALNASSSDPQNLSSSPVYCAGVLTVTPSKTVTSTYTPTIPPITRIVINEVAWAGTEANSSDEWIELYNPNAFPVDLNGWALDDRNLSTTTHHWTIILSGTIPGKGYYLLENDQNTTSVPGDQIDGTISLTNDNNGDVLKLFDPFRSTPVDTANIDGGKWPAGSSSPKCSMERAKASAPDTDSGWFTVNSNKHVAKDANGKWICGTPKNKNWAYSVTATATPEPTRTRTATATNKPTRTNTRTPAPASVSPVVLNEFLTQPRSDWNGDGVIDSGDAFVEIKNLGPVAMSLNGWWLDDQEGDSPRYTLPDETIQPGVRRVYFAKDTKIIFSNGGDSVRLFRSNGQAMDVYTYGVIKVPDQSWCRLPDGAPESWTFGCEPTPNDTNRPARSVFVSEQNLPALCLSQNLPPGLYQAECLPSGLEIWSPSYWLGELQAFFPIFIQRDDQLDVLE